MKRLPRFFQCLSLAIVAMTALSLFGVSYASTEEIEHTGTGRGYSNKSVHSSASEPFYKKPNQGSFTGPFDYGTGRQPEVRKEPAGPTGKCNCFTFDGTKSYDPDKQKLTYEWDFGDGTTGDQPVMKHCYEKAGDYTVTLTVRDESGEICGNGVTTTKVNANFPPTAVAGEDKEACLGESLTFDASGSSTSSYDSKYTWDFGDGETAEGEKVTHSYAKPGNYRVRLTVDDGKNTECSVAQDSIQAVITERAEVTLSDAASACVGKTTHFQANGSGVSKYTWDFGDGHTATGGSRASHAYEKSGTYTVRVTGDSGRPGNCSTASDSTTVVITAPPIAKAGDNLACCVDQVTSFDGSGSSSPDGRPLTYHWNFGDGTTGEGAKVSHAYSKTGNYRVTLTVKDDSGSECSVASDSFVANVNAKPEAVIEVK